MNDTARLQSTPLHTSWIGTNSGLALDLINPLPEQIELPDIITGLCNTVRFTGQMEVPYTVGHHSLLVASLVPDHLKFQALLHDATEAYIGDVSTPLKGLIGDAYRNIERRINRAIGDKFSVDLNNLDPLVKQADRIAVVAERDHYMRVPLRWSDDFENTIRVTLPQQIKSNLEIKTEFRYKFVEYSRLRR